MSADFPAAVGQNHFESLHADSCGSLQGRTKKKYLKNKKSTSSSPLPLQLSITGWSKLGLLNLKMPPTFHFISCVDLELINRNDRSRIGQMEKNNNQINPHIKQGNKVYFL